MKKENLIWCIGMSVLVATGYSSETLAKPNKLDSASTIKLVPLSKHGVFSPKAGALLFDADGIRKSDSEVVVSSFTLNTVVDGYKVEIPVPELLVEQVEWVADPIGCEDSDPKTKCHPTWGVEYSGQVGGYLPVFVDYANGSEFSPYGIVNLTLSVTVVDEKIQSIEGYFQITYSVPTDLPNFRIPVSGKPR